MLIASMVNASSPQSVYYQTASCGNLPRLLDSLIQADIAYKVLNNLNYLPTPAGDSTEIVGLQLSPAGYAKFVQVFVGQRCTQLHESGDHTFWDSRTGLTINILIDQAPPIIADVRNDRRPGYHHRLNQLC
ncbi:hypothetical protein IQ266_02765 [filamentous cyanobacterium LEGE 11480]|uniref:Uncharacterized protein n=1 Tax=Romeriopsis navalis LEGE 11480 TaxID=2777977 RepID=A0A928VMF3_9CYAN|nr:hypothetical protein [Romeriopsis navalis]MBE9028679.1 hypothetical protein [Romeriopsis navalis LEGE 11480]